MYVVAAAPFNHEVSHFKGGSFMAQVIAAPLSAPIPRPRLRELGVYTLPDGREFIVSTIYHDGCSLYSSHAWETFGTAEYWVDREGRMLNRGEPSIWKIEDLTDTGKSASYPKPVLR
jgi:hypothetical protein